jgi:hypothetical protein
VIKEATEIIIAYNNKEETESEIIAAQGLNTKQLSVLQRY